MSTMAAAFISAKEQISVRQTAVPAPGPGQVLVRVRACGVCGTDLHFYSGALPISPEASPGHEYAGEVAAIGEGVEGVALGQRVAVEPIISCRECSYCRTGSYHLCRKLVRLATPGTGALAEYVAVPAYALYTLPEALDFELGALVEPLAVAVHGLHIADLKLGERVLVLGSGTIGLLSVLAARAAGAGEIIATYRHEHQGEAALAVGAARAVRADAVSGLSKEKIDVVVETIGGTAPTLGEALGVVRPGGRISLLGVFTGAVQLNALVLMLKEVRIVGGVTYCRPGAHSDFDVALRILESDPERARALITHRFPLADAGKAFATAADKSTRSLKVQVQT